ncbi:MAG: VWA domain-containing protein [Alphaproteobacteria bacterium]|nr:VWA domain-containing protein [Alphaproteobacteria bacterium]
MLDRLSALLRLLTIALVVFATGGQASVQAADENVMLVLDGSGSMWGRVDGEPKIAIAKRVVSQVLGDLAGKVNMGVIAYGHRSKGDCKDIQTLIPVGPVNAEDYMSVIGKVQPKGKTPITDAVRRGADELKYREEKATIILVSDGLETCEADPCALARELEGQGIDFTVHVVGFDLRKQDTTSLQCLAEETGGKYLPADSASELGSAIGEVVAEVKEPTPEPAPKPAAAKNPTTLKVDVQLSEDQPPLPRAYVRVRPAKGEKEVAGGAARNQLKVKPGTYYLTSKVGAASGSVEATVEENAKNEAKIILNAGQLKVTAVPNEGAEPLTKAYIYIEDLKPDANGKRRRVTAGNQRNTFTVPAATYRVIAKLGKAAASETVDIKPGKRTDLTIILGSGTLKVNVLAAEGGKPVSNAYVRVYESEPQVDGKRRQVTAGNQRNTFTLPAGRYFVTGTVGKAVASKQIEISSGKRLEQTLVAAVGGLKVSVVPAEGAKPLKTASIYIFVTDKGLDGKRKRITSGNMRNTFKLPAGKYYVEARSGLPRSGSEVELGAGKLSELTININAGSLNVQSQAKVHVTVFEAEKDLEGKRARINAFHTGRPVLLPAGKYVLVGKLKGKRAEAEVEITAGKMTEIKLDP